MRRKQAVAVSLAGVVAAIGAISCSDIGRSLEPQVFAAEGPTFSVAWVPDGHGGVQLGAMWSGTAGKFETPEVDSGRAIALAMKLSAPHPNRGTAINTSAMSLSYSMAGPHAGATRSTAPAPTGPESKMKFRGARTHLGKVGGKDYSLLLVPDPDRSAHKPTMAMVVMVNDHVVSITEWQYRKAGGGWQHSATRTTRMDSTGKTLMVIDAEESSTMTVGQSVARPVKRITDKVLGVLALAVQPDALYAMSPSDDPSVLCGAEVTILAGATLAVSMSAAKAIAATAAARAADVAVDDAIAACIIDFELCPAMGAAIVARRAAFAWQAECYTNLASDTALAAGAEALLKECIRRHIGGQGGGDESSCGKTLSCDVGLYESGGLWYFTEDNCVCEGIYQT